MVRAPLFLLWLIGVGQLFRGISCVQVSRFEILSTGSDSKLVANLWELGNSTKGLKTFRRLSRGHKMDKRHLQAAVPDQFDCFHFSQ